MVRVAVAVDSGVREGVWVESMGVAVFSSTTTTELVGVPGGKILSTSPNP
jgi:hypothetical protein